MAFIWRKVLETYLWRTIQGVGEVYLAVTYRVRPQHYLPISIWISQSPVMSIEGRPRIHVDDKLISLNIKCNSALSSNPSQLFSSIEREQLRLHPSPSYRTMPKTILYDLPSREPCEAWSLNPWKSTSELLLDLKAAD